MIYMYISWFECYVFKVYFNNNQTMFLLFLLFNLLESEFILCIYMYRVVLK